MITADLGAAVGLGATTMTMCDIVVAYRRAAIANPRVSAGIVASDGGVIGGLQPNGRYRARRYFLTQVGLTAEHVFVVDLIRDLFNTLEKAPIRA